MSALSDILDSISGFFEEFGDVFTQTLFKIGNSEISLSSIIYFIVATFLLIYLSGKLKKILIKRIGSKYPEDKGTLQSVSTIIRYVVLVVGLLVIIQSAGIDLSALSILAGALGVGIGFGLQNITNNFISGIIILLERPIKAGDRIEVGDVKGDVVDIRARSTTVITNDNITLIVPNSEFISSTVINWSHNDRNVRFRFPVGVAYKEDPAQVKQLLLEVAKENTDVLSIPEPDVLFDEFGDSSLNFTLMVWTTEYIDRPNILKSQLYFAIFEKFKEYDIEIPFPQRDLHVKSGINPLESHS
ncbi:MAG: mechanosensitive ion channel domain-containing protein [Bacteroidota bacterium]